MIKLFKTHKRLKANRKKYRIKPTVSFAMDRNHYGFAFLPTIFWMPWFKRHPDMEGVIDIWWLYFHILIGTWTVKEEGK